MRRAYPGPGHRAGSSVESPCGVDRLLCRGYITQDHPAVRVLARTPDAARMEERAKTGERLKMPSREPVVAECRSAQVRHRADSSLTSQRRHVMYSRHDAQTCASAHA